MKILFETTEGWNTQKYNLNRWLSNKVQHWKTNLKLLPTIWFVQWNPCLYDLGHIFCDGWSLPIYNMGVAAWKNYFVFKRRGWWNDVSGVRMTWASIGISSSESSQSLDTRHHHYHRRRRRHHCRCRRRHVPLAAQNNDFISLVFNKTHRWTCIQIRSLGRTRTFASSDESPIFCFPL